MTWKTSDGDEITCWRWDGDSIEVQTVSGQWITYAAGMREAEDNMAWLRLHGVPEVN